MSFDFYIVDDDRSVRKMLMQIIEGHFCDASILQNDDPWMAVQDILKYHPDLVLLDLLMGELDGIEVAQRIRQGNFRGRIVMLSEVTDKEMVEKAYDAGVDDYISKPINVTEVCRVVKRNLEHLQLSSYVRLMGTPQVYASPNVHKSDTSKVKLHINNLYKDLGIIGELGTDELAFWAIACSTGEFPITQTSFTLSEFYQWLKDNYPAYQNGSISLKGIEQRIRRLIIIVTENIAHMGIEDFSGYKFEKYSTALFNFKTIKLEMDYIRNPSVTKGKVDAKRFLDGFLNIVE